MIGTQYDACDILNGENENSPHLSVLVAEIDQAGNVEEKLDKVVQH